MKYIILPIVLLSLIGCKPAPINEATSKAIKGCLDKGWNAEYFSKLSSIKFKCNKNKEQK